MYLFNIFHFHPTFTLIQNGAHLSSERGDDANGDNGDGAGKGGSSNEEIEARVERRLKTSLSSRVVLHRLEVGHSCDDFCQLWWWLFLSHLEVSTVLNNPLSGHIKFASKARSLKSKKIYLARLSISMNILHFWRPWWLWLFGLSFVTLKSVTSELGSVGWPVSN